MAPSLSLPLIRSIHRPCIRLARPEIGVEARIAPGTRPWASASGCLIPWPLGHILPCCRCHPSAIARCHRRGRGGPSHAPSYALAAHSHTRARALARSHAPYAADHRPRAVHRSAEARRRVQCHLGMRRRAPQRRHLRRRAHRARRGSSAGEGRGGGAGARVQASTQVRAGGVSTRALRPAATARRVRRPGGTFDGV